ncbi:MAG: phosphoribosylformylglycinamidine synthase, partial [Lentisphaerae bacterium]|nr:phosphoribosylformylglycinamidine synthase [Lentisphaerota bacterium]
LVRANKALYDLTTAYKVPCISGKDSCKNDSTRGGRKISIPPTVLFSTIARMADVRLAVTMNMKRAGDFVYVIGLTRREMGASAFYRLLAEREGRANAYGGAVPKVEPGEALALYGAMAEATRQGLLSSSHTPTRGGLAVALALSALGGNLGADVDLGRVPAEGELTEDEILFAESNSRFVVTVTPDRRQALEALFTGLPCVNVGQVTGDTVLQVRDLRGRPVIRSPLDGLRKAFKKTLYGV